MCFPLTLTGLMREQILEFVRWTETQLEINDAALLANC